MTKNKLSTEKIIESYDLKVKQQGFSIHTVLDVSGADTNYLYDYYSKYYIKKFAEFSKNDNVLDFGCGLGRLSFEYSHLVNSIDGVDISVSLIDLAIQQNKKSNVTFRKIDAINEIQGTYDKIILFGVLLHISDNELDDLILKFSEILNESGKIVFIEPLGRESKRVGDEILYRTPSEIEHKFQQFHLKKMVHKQVLRNPSYSFHLLKKLKIKNRFMFTVYRWVESLTIRRKSNLASFFWHLYVFEKK